MQIQAFGLGTKVEVEDPETLGGKGAGLVWMSKSGFNVPPGFVIPTTVWQQYVKAPATTLKDIEKSIKPYLDMLQKKFGYMPLLSVRSGARVSCPGMMDTILNVGLCDANTSAWDKRLGKACVSNSMYRLLEMYGSTVLGMPKAVIHEAKGEFLPQDPMKQIMECVKAVFGSWNNERAKFYRKLNNIPDEWGTACVIQAMVFGNLNDKSGTGVLFTRNPDTGEGKIKGEFLINAQGEDVVDGSHTPMPLEKMSDWNDPVYVQLQKAVLKLEELKGDVQDVEFTIQDGELFILQTRSAKRSPKAAVRIALDMFKEGSLKTAGDLLGRVTARDLDLCQQKEVGKGTGPADFVGIGACGGVAVGVPVFSAQDAINCKVPCILITEETNPDDLEGMHSAAAIVTMKGGETCHAAVVARGMNKPCVVGVGQEVSAFKNVNMMSVEGQTGRVWLNAVEVTEGSKDLADDFKSTVIELSNSVPVLTSPNAKPLAEAWVILGQLMAEPHKCVELLVKITKNVGVTYVDLESMDHTELSFFTQIGGVVPFRQMTLQELADHKQFMGKIKLVGAKHKAFEHVSVLNSLEDLVMSSTVAVSMLKPSDAVAKVMKWKQAEGLTLVALGDMKAPGKKFIQFEQLLNQ